MCQRVGRGWGEDDDAETAKSHRNRFAEGSREISMEPEGSAVDCRSPGGLDGVRWMGWRTNQARG